MTLRYPGGFIRAAAPTVNTGSAVGVWVNSQILPYRAADTWPVYVPFDPYFNYTTLLLPGNGTNGAQNNTFVDSSTNAFTITRNGNTTQGTFSPFSQTGWGNYFDGSGDELTLSTTTAAQIGANDFSFECFVYPTRQTNTYAQGLISYGIVGSISGTSYASLQMSPTGYAAFYYAQTSVETLADTTLLPLHQWSHVAACRSGSTLSLFVNGSRVATTTTSATVGSSGDRITIGGQFYENASTRQLQGYISNARIVKGSSAYDASQTTITVPTAPLTAIANTSLLTCQSNRFIDTSANAYAITAAGNTSIQAFSPFNPTAAWSAATNGGSGYFDGSGDYLTAANNAALYFDTGDFTVECWINTSATVAYQTIASVYGTPTINNGWYFSLNATGVGLYFSFFNGSTGSSLDAGSGLNDGAWHHVAAVRTGTALSIYIDGTRVATTTNSYNITSTANLRISGYAGTSRDWNGFISDFRIIKGSGPYDAAQSTLTVPTAPLTAITNTSLLLDFTNAGIYDATAKNDLETVGNAQISTTQSKFGGSSMYFDGTGDYLYRNGTSDLFVAGGDFTVECWVYLNSTSGTQVFVGYGGVSWYLCIGDVSAGKAQFTWANTTPTNYHAVGTTTLSTGQWYHVAGVKYGSDIYLYVDGVQEATTAISGSQRSPSTNALSVGASPNGGSTSNAYIQDVRITKGYARYTTGFTPPTAAFQLY